MKTPALTLVAVATFLPVAPASAKDGANPPAKEQVEASAQKIKELEKERIAALETLVAINTKLFQAARVEVGEVVDASQLLLQARLDAAEKEADRAALYEQAAALLKQYEELAKGRMQAGQGAEAAVWRIRARRLDFEIRLERAKNKEAGGAAPQPAAQKQIEAAAQKIKEFQKERLAALTALVDQAATAFQAARAPYEEVLKAQVLLLEGELDAAAKESDRIEIYKKTVETLKKLEERAQLHVQAGRATTAGVYAIQAQRLGVEIQLERAKIKEAKEGK